MQSFDPAVDELPFGHVSCMCRSCTFSQLFHSALLVVYSSGCR